MQTIPDDIVEKYSTVLKKRAVPVSRHNDYKKWLRYYLDFRSKYPLPDSKSEHVRLFIQKLWEKKQTPEQQKQAAHALSLYFETQRKMDNETPTAQINTENAVKTTSTSTHPPTPPLLRGNIPNLSRVEAASRASLRSSAPPLPNGSRYNEWRCLEKTGYPAWDKIIDTLAAEIKTRHYSRKTLKAYADWSRKFQSYLRNKPPDELSATDVKAYITYLAVTCKVSASTQNQAFNALLFLFRHILKKISAITRTFHVRRNRHISPWFFPVRRLTLF